MVIVGRRHGTKVYTYMHTSILSNINKHILLYRFTYIVLFNVAYLVSFIDTAHMHA